MAGTLTKDQILDGISELSVLELSELLKEFEAVSYTHLDVYKRQASRPWTS